MDSVISFTTDYGLEDGFAGVCRAVIASNAPEAHVVDITHGVPPGDVRRGAHVLAQAVPYFPDRTVHLAVVDPGVGSVRHPLGLATPQGHLVGPDNGLLPWAADALGGITQAIALTNDAFHRHPVSRTFHGRDVFAPAAAHLARGGALTELGDPLNVRTVVRLPEPHVKADGDGLDAEVTTVDRFGNVQLAADAAALDAFGENLTVDGRAAVRGDMFSATRGGGLVVLVDSAGRAAVAVNGGDAAATLDVAPGDVVRIRQA